MSDLVWKDLPADTPSGPGIPDDIFEDLDPPEGLPEDIKAITVMDITKRIFAVRKVEAKLAQIKVTKQETLKYFRGREERLEAAIEELKGQMRAYMDYHSVRSFPTMAGTVFIRRSDGYEWDDAAVLAWVDKEHPELASRLVRVKLEVDKNAVKEFIKETGELIPGVTITPKESVNVKSP